MLAAPMFAPFAALVALPRRVLTSVPASRHAIATASCVILAYPLNQLPPTVASRSCPFRSHRCSVAAKKRFELPTIAARAFAPSCCAQMLPVPTRRCQAGRRARRCVPLVRSTRRTVASARAGSRTTHRCSPLAKPPLALPLRVAAMLVCDSVRCHARAARHPWPFAARSGSQASSAGEAQPHARGPLAAAAAGSRSRPPQLERSHAPQFAGSRRDCAQPKHRCFSPRPSDAPDGRGSQCSVARQCRAPPRFPRTPRVDHAERSSGHTTAANNAHTPQATHGPRQRRIAHGETQTLLRSRCGDRAVTRLPRAQPVAQKTQVAAAPQKATSRAPRRVAQGEQAKQRRSQLRTSGNSEATEART
ncbi:hypothetical protein, conserved in T. vivax [Trypanosoma vivax Y486]|uniref:Proteophosphoglycan ppg4 n=1 Tax=Trypanosoma vivax (strain Y486) TaxID=1055687 RepID=F9WT07_TRYVY|nr:hypothetical protein, conserved in T. vivax [Trypanosoma vivax Y486]|eukprot:CCD20696.1 hypothetical protein, conserved in T. vivax [Trypanosoma vivax Y486]